MSACELCTQDGGEVLYRDASLRVVLIDDAQYPGFCRVIWNAHATEMTDLTPPQRSQLMQVVCNVETALRDSMQPDKVNLASFGNVVPHLHWHVIPRYVDDAHFPQPVWGQVQREPSPALLATRRALLPALRNALKQQLSDLH